MSLVYSTGRAVLHGSAIAIILALGATVGLTSKAYADPLPIESLAQFESMTGAVISPDGKHIAALIAVKGQKWPVISVWNTDNLAKTPVWIPSATNRIVNISFFDNEHLFFITEQDITQTDGRPSFTRKLYWTDLLGKTIEEPFKMTGTKNKDVRDALERGISVGIVSNELYDENLVLLSRVNPESLDTEIVELNKKTGATRIVAKNSEKYSFDYAGVDLATGELMIRQAVEPTGRDNKYHLITQIKDRKTGQWVEHPKLGYKLEDRSDLSVLGFETPDKLFVRTNLERDKSAIYSYDIPSQTMDAEPLYANDNYDIIGINLKQDPVAKKVDSVFSITIGGPATRQIFLDPEWEAKQNGIKAAFPGKNVYLRVNKKFGIAIVTVEGSDQPPVYFLFKDNKLVKLGEERPWIDPAKLGKSEWVVYKARDGLDIPAIVTYPPGWTQASGPVATVVLPHGGPWARDELSWDSSGWPQFLATRNIAVIQPQYRGSEGLGAKLWKAGDGEWGQKMSDDNDDAAAYLVGKGIADPKKLAIFGYSYGGFAAIAASVRSNGPYRCAISGAGVSSLERLGGLWGDGLIAREVQGKTVAGMDPLKNVANANIPIMLYHGDRDRQADTEHSRMFFKAMKAAGKDVEYTEIKGMWHTLPWHPEWHTQSLTLIENYLKSAKCGLL